MTSVNYHVTCGDSHVTCSHYHVTLQKVCLGERGLRERYQRRYAGESSDGLWWTSLPHWLRIRGASAAGSLVDGASLGGGYRSHYILLDRYVLWYYS